MTVMPEGYHSIFIIVSDTLTFLFCLYLASKLNHAFHASNLLQRRNDLLIKST